MDLPLPYKSCGFPYKQRMVLTRSLVDPGASGSCCDSLWLLHPCYCFPKALPQALACGLRRGEVPWVFDIASFHCCRGCSWTCRFKESSWLSPRIAGLGSDTQEPSNLLHYGPPNCLSAHNNEIWKPSSNIRQRHKANTWQERRIWSSVWTYIRLTWLAYPFFFFFGIFFINTQSF